METHRSRIPASVEGDGNTQGQMCCLEIRVRNGVVLVGFWFVYILSSKNLIPKRGDQQNKWEEKGKKNPVKLQTAAGWSSPSSLLQAHSSPLEWEPKVSVSLFLCRSRCHQPCQTMFSSQVLWHWGPPESHHQVFLWLSPDVWLIKNSLKGYTAMMVVPFLSWTETFEGGGAHSVSSSKHLLAPWRGANHNRSLTRRKLNLAQRPFGGSYMFPVRTQLSTLEQ